VRGEREGSFRCGLRTKPGTLRLAPQCGAGLNAGRGRGQVPRGCVLLLDETVMEEGEMEVAGLEGLNACRFLMSNMNIPIDYRRPPARPRGGRVGGSGP
jgi:hypothetical protein